MERIRRNYRFVMGFNGALIVLGALGVLPPATSALLHNSSTLLLSLDSMTDLMTRREETLSRRLSGKRRGEDAACQPG